MKALKIILLSIAILCVIVYAGMAWMGFFTKIEAKEKPIGGYVLVGSEYIGDYSKSYCTMMKVDSELKAMGIICTKGFGIYYDNPQVTPKEKCRSLVGNVLETKDSAKIEELKSKGFKVEFVAEKQSLVIEYPIKNDMSYMVGAMKAYPLFNEYMTQKGIKPSLSLEIYDIPLKKIFYIMQFDK